MHTNEDPTGTPPGGFPPQQTARPKRHWVRWTAAGIAGAFVVAVIAAGVAGSGGSNPAVPVITSPVTSTAPPTAQQPVEAPTPVDTPTTTNPHEQALLSAQSYLSDGQGFSRAGLIEQLSSSAGEGFSHADAVWAVDHSGADWNQQAYLSAQGYMSDGQGFSRSGLIDQLTSPYGEQFTLAQATYAANKVGL